MKKILSLIDATNTWIGKVTSILSLVVALIITYEIFMREVLVKPTLWVAEGTVFGCGLLYLLGGAWTLKQDGHVRVDMLYHGLSRRGKAMIDCVTYFAFLLYITVMIWASWQYMEQSIAVRETTMSPWDPIIWPFKVALVASLIMLLMQQTAKFVRDLYFVMKGEEL
ncbi:TRAP transporter small permease subunit [bacterium]|nr:TRAP transporter small permease subunit [bacterium]